MNLDSEYSSRRALEVARFVKQLYGDQAPQALKAKNYYQLLRSYRCPSLPKTALVWIVISLDNLAKRLAQKEGNDAAEIFIEPVVTPPLPTYQELIRTPPPPADPITAFKRAQSAYDQVLDLMYNSQLTAEDYDALLASIQRSKRMSND